MSRTSMTIAALSTVVEWYDFTLYLYLATVLSRVFFGGGAESVLATLAAFAVSFCLRPLGALYFGRIGDRFGRRRMMLLSMALMSVAMLATALLPTPQQVGAWSGALLLLLRCVMAFSVGGEYTGVVAYLLEGAPENRRGLITSTASAASEIGALLAVLVAASLASALSQPQLDTWGWRIAYFAGAVLAGAVWIARSRMEESPDFERQVAEHTVPDAPFLLTLREHRSGLMRSFSISALGSITYYVGITYVPAYLYSLGEIGEPGSLWTSTLAAIVVILVTPLFGALSDVVGRRPVLIGLAIAGVLLPLALFSLIANSDVVTVVVATVILACLAGGVSAVGAAATAEQFPGEGRLTGLALGATVATAVFGGMTPLAAHYLATHTGWSVAPGAMIAMVALVVLPIVLRMPETRPGYAR